MTSERKRILCVEDDRDTAALISEEFIERGYDVTLAYDGQEGLRAILRIMPDIVLSDVSMPIMSGFEMLERVTAIAPRCRNIPFIYLTALVDRDRELQGRRLGADDYVTKPIDFDILAAIINSRLARVNRVDIWPLDIELNQREIEALVWSARGKTSAEIATLMNITKRTVDFHIDNARAKLGASTRIEAVVRAVSGGLIRP